MFTPRKAAIIAVFVLTALYLFHSSSTSSPTVVDAPAQSPKAQINDAVPASAPQTTGRPAGTSQELSRPYPPPRNIAPEKKIQQQPLADPVSKSLRERLQYQFPYDLEGKFPAYIWQTWKYTPASGDFSEALRGAEASWTEKHPGFVHEVVTDEAAVYLLRHLYASVPEVVEAYKSLPMPILKADFFRYLILLARGGIYSDIDTTALQSATDWLPKEVPRSTVGLIVGIEADPDRPDWQKWFSRRIQFCQWTIQAKAGHPVLRDVVASVTQETLRMKKKGTLKANKLDKTVMEFTGPAVFTDAVFSYMNSPDYFKMDGKNISWEAFTGIETAKKVGDVVVLPITSFSPGVGQMGAKETDDPMAFVRHDFEGRSQAVRIAESRADEMMQVHGSPKVKECARKFGTDLHTSLPIHQNNLFSPLQRKRRRHLLPPSLPLFPSPSPSSTATTFIMRSRHVLEEENYLKTMPIDCSRSGPGNKIHTEKDPIRITGRDSTRLTSHTHNSHWIQELNPALVILLLHTQYSRAESCDLSLAFQFFFSSITRRANK